MLPKGYVGYPLSAPSRSFLMLSALAPISCAKGEFQPQAAFAQLQG